MGSPALDKRWPPALESNKTEFTLISATGIPKEKADDAYESFDFQKRLACIRASRALLKLQQRKRKERAAQLRIDFQQITEQLQLAHKEAVGANERHRKLLRVISSTCQECQGKDRESMASVADCELSLIRGREDSEHIRASRRSPKLRKMERSPKRSSKRSTVILAERHNHPRKSSPDAGILKPRRFSAAENDSSSGSSSSGSVNATPRFGKKSSKAKKSLPFVPRLDLAQTTALTRASPEMRATMESTHQKPQLLNEFETISRRTARRTDSARLISLTDADNLIGNTDSARTMLTRIKRRAKGGCLGGDGAVITESVAGDGKVAKRVPEEVSQSGPIDLREPSVREMVITAMQSFDGVGGTEITKDGAQNTPVQDLQEHSSSTKITLEEGQVPCDHATSSPNLSQSLETDVEAPMKAGKSDGDTLSKVTYAQEKKTQILLWSAKEKLSALHTLNNTMFLWEDNQVTCGTWLEDVDLVLSGLTAAKESQRKLFDMLSNVQGIPRRAVCRSAVRELVRLYPPERLIPTSFINEHLVAKFQEMMVDESKPMSATLRSAHDSEAAEFWQSLVQHITSLADHKMSTAEQSAEDFTEVLLHEIREPDILGAKKLARLELQNFLTRHFRPELLEEQARKSTQGEELVSLDTSNMFVAGEWANSNQSSKPSQADEIGTSTQVRNIVVTSGNANMPLASKHCKKSLSTYFSSLKFWRRKTQKPDIDINYLDRVNLNRSMK